MSVEQSSTFPTQEQLDQLVQTDPAAALQLAGSWHARAGDDHSQSPYSKLLAQGGVMGASLKVSSSTALSPPAPAAAAA